MNTVRIDVSRRWPSETINAILIIVSLQELTPKEALTRFRRSLGQWLANTVQGKDLWEESSQDFNYGDFRMWDVDKDPAFLEFMLANGLVSAEVVRLDEGIEDIEETWDSTIYPEST